MIALRGITKRYVMGDIEVHALRGVDLDIDDGEFVAIMGPSGSGKSTLMNIIGCLDVPTSGSYQLDGIEVSGLTDDQLTAVRNRKLGFVFQSFNLLPRLSAIEQVEVPLIYARVPNRRALAREALERVGLGDRTHHKPTELSGGQQQRVAIARALVTQPSLILADEPTGALDTRTTEEVIRLFEKLNEQGMTVVFVTHEPEVAAHTRRQVHIRDGEVVEDTGRTALTPRPPLPPERERGSTSETDDFPSAPVSAGTQTQAPLSRSGGRGVGGGGHQSIPRQPCQTQAPLSRSGGRGVGGEGPERTP